MKEEDVTKSVLKWLLDNEWKIICFDFPQSGTGRFLHPNLTSNHKNLKSINPDIVAVKGEKGLFFENKDRFYLLDFEKQNYLKTNNDYSDDINKLLASYNINIFYYGIGLPTSKFTKVAQDSSYLVDFIVGVNEDKTIKVLHTTENEIFNTI